MFDSVLFPSKTPQHENKNFNSGDFAAAKPKKPSLLEFPESPAQPEPKLEIAHPQKKNTWMSPPYRYIYDSSVLFHFVISSCTTN